MADDSVRRTVTVERIAPGKFSVANTRGGQFTFGTGSGAEFTPTELLLAAIGGCTAIDVDILTSRRAEPDRFQVRAEANKVRDTNGNRLTDIHVTFQITFPADEHGDEARAVLPEVVKKSHDRLCTVYLDNLDCYLSHSGPFRARNLRRQSRIPGVSRGSVGSALASPSSPG